jgi:hypothetical protein
MAPINQWKGEFQSFFTLFARPALTGLPARPARPIHDPQAFPGAMRQILLNFGILCFTYLVGNTNKSIRIKYARMT